jgi:hypothetical protein
MKLYSRYLASLFIIVFSQACTEIIDIDLPEHEEKIIVNSFFTSGEQIKVHLSKSIPVLKDSIPLCDDAFVRLLEGNIIIDTLHRDGDYYYSDVLAQTSKEYSLIINVPGMDSVVCHDVIPELVPIQSYKLADSLMIDEYGCVVMQFEFDFIDPPGINYYEISMNIDPWYLWFMNNTDPVITTTGILDYEPGTLIFSDNLFDGKTASIKVNYSVEAYVFPRIGNDPKYEYNLNISFRSISESYYLFKQKQIVYLFSLQSDIFTGASEPVQLYSNVKGGYGIFAGYSSDDRTINVVVQ